MREWNPNWQDISPNQVTSMRNMVVASINWIENHSEARPEWQESETGLWFKADWETVYRATNEDAHKWFRVIIAASGTERPSGIMMSKAIGCALMLKQVGWEVFDRFMQNGVLLSPPSR